MLKVTQSQRRSLPLPGGFLEGLDMNDHRPELREDDARRTPSKRRTLRRAARIFVLLSAAGVMPAFMMRCDKAALNVQRGFFVGLGQQVSEVPLTVFEDEDG